MLMWKSISSGLDMGQSQSVRVRPSMYLLFKCSLNALHMQAVILHVGVCSCSCAYSDKLSLCFFNRCALETWGVMLRVTSSPGLSLLTWMSELCLQSCSEAYTHTDLLNWLRTWNLSWAAHIFFIREGSKCRFPYISGNVLLIYYLFTYTYLYFFLIYETYIMYYV